jgi:hypothetical protein
LYDSFLTDEFGGDVRVASQLLPSRLPQGEKFRHLKKDTLQLFGARGFLDMPRQPVNALVFVDGALGEHAYLLPHVLQRVYPLRQAGGVAFAYLGKRRDPANLVKPRPCGLGGYVGGCGLSSFHGLKASLSMMAPARLSVGPNLRKATTYSASPANPLPLYRPNPQNA